MIKQVRRQNWARQGMLVEYEITDGNCVSPPGNHTYGTDLGEDQ